MRALFTRAMPLMVITIGGAFYCFEAGKRGFFALDQSIAFDAGYRILSGQIPYKDFYFSHGLPLYYFQAAFLSLFGLSFNTLLLTAAVLSAVCISCSYKIIGNIFPDSSLAPLLSAIITAFWLWPPYGTPFPDAFAYTCVLLALLSTLALRHPLIGTICAGVFMAVAVFTKLSIGVAYFPILFVSSLFWRPERRSRILSGATFISAFSFTSFAALFAIASFSSISNFVKFALAIPLQLGLERTSQSMPNLSSLSEYFNFPALTSVQIALLSLAICLIALIATLKLVERFDYRIVTSVVLLFGVISVTILVKNITFNNPSLSYPFVGLAIGLTLGLIEITSRSGFYRAIAGAFSIVAIFVGHQLAWDRLSLDPVAGSTFAESPLPISNFRLNWGRPTLLANADISEESLVGLVNFLRSTNAPFFTFPDHTILYGLLGTASPQPLLWFHSGLTYTPGDKELESEIISALCKAKIRHAVLETKSFLGTPGRLAEFPHLSQLMLTESRIVAEFDTFQVRELPVEFYSSCQ